MARVSRLHIGGASDGIVLAHRLLLAGTSVKISTPTNSYANAVPIKLCAHAFKTLLRYLVDLGAERFIFAGLLGWIL